MALKFSGVDVTSIVFNGQTVDSLLFNGTEVFTSASPPAGDPVEATTTSAPFGGDVNALDNTYEYFYTNFSVGQTFTAVQKEYPYQVDINGYTIEGLTWNDSSSTATATLYVQYSNDGTTWDTIEAIDLSYNKINISSTKTNLGVSGKYFRLYMGQFGSNGQLEIRHLSVDTYQSESPSVDSAPFGGTAAYADDNTNYFSSNTSTGSAFTFLQKNFAESTRITSYEINQFQWVASAQPATLSVQISQDDATWVTIQQFNTSGGAAAANIINNNISYECKHIRLRMTAFGSNGYVKLLYWNVDAFPAAAQYGVDGELTVPDSQSYSPNAYEGIAINKSATHIVFAGDGSDSSTTSYIAVHQINSDRTIGSRVGNVINTGRPHAEQFGWRMGLSDAGDKLIVTGSNSQYVHVYVLSGGSWTLGNSIDMGAKTYHQMSCDMAADGTWAYFGEPYHNGNAGRMWWINIDGTSVSNGIALYNSTYSLSYDYYGTYSCISGNYALLPSQGYGSTPSRNGRYGIGRRNPATGTWSLAVFSYTGRVGNNQMGAGGFEFEIIGDYGYVIGLGLTQMEVHVWNVTETGYWTSYKQFTVPISTLSGDLESGAGTCYGIPFIKEGHLYIGFNDTTANHWGWQKWLLLPDSIEFVDAVVNLGVSNKTQFAWADQGAAYIGSTDNLIELDNTGTEYVAVNPLASHEAESLAINSAVYDTSLINTIRVNQSENGQYLVVTDLDSDTGTYTSVKVLELTNGQITGVKHKINAVSGQNSTSLFGDHISVSDDGDVIGVGNREGQYWVFDYTTGSQVMTYGESFSTNYGNSIRVSVSPNGQRMVTGNPIGGSSYAGEIHVLKKNAGVWQMVPMIVYNVGYSYAGQNVKAYDDFYIYTSHGENSLNGRVRFMDYWTDYNFGNSQSYLDFQKFIINHPTGATDTRFGVNLRVSQREGGGYHLFAGNNSNIYYYFEIVDDLTTVTWLDTFVGQNVDLTTDRYFYVTDTAGDVLYGYIDTVDGTLNTNGSFAIPASMSPGTQALVKASERTYICYYVQLAGEELKAIDLSFD